MPRHPNILWIYCDELRADALGCYGHPAVKMRTPWLDQLAESGARFTNCFVNSPVCVPSRTSTLTGRYPEQTGAYHNEAVWEGFPQPPASLMAFPRVLEQQGYATANFGKAHVPETLRPWQHHDPRGGAGVELRKEMPAGDPTVICAPGLPSSRVAGVFPAGRPYPPAAVAANAMEWMAAAPRPFLARTSILQPHTPVFPQPPFDKLYADSALDGVTPARPHASQFERTFAKICAGEQMPPENVRRSRLCYYGLVAWIDTQVGLLLEFLRARGLLQETIVVFDADHGASLGEGGCYAKHLFAPQTHRVPRIISWPGTLPAGEVRDDLTDGIDLGRTLMGLCGVAAPPQFEGRNLFADAAPEAVYATIGYGRRDSFALPVAHVGRYEGGRGWPRRACVRTRQYRLDKNVLIDGLRPTAQEADLFLADVLADPLEAVNLAGDPRYGATAAALEADLDRHLRRCSEDQ